ncbi:Cell shape-determining protein MreC [Usitatibacter rugosus]|uniref:Cell shape-determining protein MreC n=1 Tax=Usitatibacter rugosus TaxID=2732067 RepID=A0A6M4H1R5_9PROT|nr:rod shape-determining protein MreC [Usitatibacter rugosus]QJR13058.1 Cell shape-determining protein MreC [Usitatibacter rugosus]
MIHDPPPFFHRGPSPLARLTFFGLVAIGLMIADHRFQALEAVRLSISVLAQPAQRAASLPGEVVSRVSDYFANQDRLMRDNQALKSQLLEQSAAAQQAKLLVKEQELLLGMAPGKSKYASEGMVAEVLYNARNPFIRKIVIDKGLTQGVRAGMPVIDGSGVVGQVTNVGTFTSEVTLLTEKGQSVPVMLVRNGVRAIISGSGKDGSLEVPFMPVSADIQNGDLFVTSGIDGTYPPGLVVAKVTTVEKNAAFVFARIVAKPAAGVDSNRYVMVLPMPPASPPAPEAKAEERKRATNPKGSRRESR